MINYAPEVVRGAKRLHHAFNKRNWPWPGVVTRWELLADNERADFLHMAALFHAAEHAHDGDTDAVVAEVVRELRPTVYPADKLTALVTARYAEYTDPYLDKD